MRRSQLDIRELAIEYPYNLTKQSKCDARAHAPNLKRVSDD